MDFDFYEEFRRLLFTRPHNALHSKSVENSLFGDYLYRTKNVYLGYFVTDSEDCYYSEYIHDARDCVDCLYVVEAELCYECIDSSSLYNCSFLQDCHNCSHCDFCFDCINCKDCFGSFGLRNRQFCIFNKQYSEETYREKITALKKQAPQKILSVLQSEFDKHPRLFARQLKGGEDCLGDYIYFSKDCYRCFNIRNVESGAYLDDVLEDEERCSDCYDCSFLAASELCYECDTISGCSNCNFLQHCIGCNDSEYLMHCYNCNNCFGCAYLSNKEYCILNRQFSREEYFVALKQIKSNLKKTGSYGITLADLLK